MTEPSPGRFGLAYTSFVIRMLRGRDVLRGGDASGLPARQFVELCGTFGVSVGQIDLAQLGTADPATLESVRSAAEERGIELELSVPAHSLEDPDAFVHAAAVSRALGVSRWRAALIYGRRYEDFAGIGEWHAFVARWRATLPRAARWLEGEGLQAGLENHKDFLAPELAELLRGVGSPHLGACLDFGNNLALLEDPMTTVEMLAPYAVTTHMKDMAVRVRAGGFDLSEVPLGTGLLPLADMVDAVRRARPGVNLCLEMITRDPLPVPYREPAYWSARDAGDPSRLAAFENDVLGRSSAAPLPTIMGLTPDEMMAAEDANVVACVDYAKERLHL